MSELRRLMGWLVLALFVSWIALSIFGAFLGSEKAAAFFSSPPMLVFGLVLGVSILAGGLVGGPGPRGIHLGCVLILAGTLMNSEFGHRLAARWGGREKIPRGYLSLQQRQVSAEVRDRTLEDVAGTLPFSVRLNEFEIDYYPLSGCRPEMHLGVLVHEPGTSDAVWKTRSVAWEPGRAVRLPGTPFTLLVRHFTPPTISGTMAADVELKHGTNRQVRSLVCLPDEPVACLVLRPVFPAVSNLHRSTSLLLVRPTRPVRQYRSLLTLTGKDGVTRARVRVNHPFHYGGYHLYQHSWAADPKPRTVLLVVSDSGLGVAGLGSLVLVGGTLWRFWIRRPAEGEGGPVP